ncbi:MAG: LysR family transcriptional regulator [Verrucomicrobia bacterium]|nr:LysR family transcriptional regulator [Verrucomicrobiota bacterium]
MIEKLRLLLVIIEEGSFGRAAQRLHISQSAVTRQIQLLEHDLGGRVLERASFGVRPTSGGHALARKARGLLADYDLVMAEARRMVRGESDRLRIGYVAAAVQEYLGPALVELRRRYPKLKVKMLDQTPGEIITALRCGEIDLGLTIAGANLLSRDFYTQKLASLPSLVPLSLEHPLAFQKQIPISKLKTESFVQLPETDAQGYNQRIAQFCRRFGNFRPRFVSIGQANSLAELLVMSANEGAISLQPSYISHLSIPNVVMVPIAEKLATWDLSIVWQGGKMSGPLRALLDSFQLEAKS